MDISKWRVELTREEHAKVIADKIEMFEAAHRKYSETESQFKKVFQTLECRISALAENFAARSQISIEFDNESGKRIRLEMMMDAKRFQPGPNDDQWFFNENFISARVFLQRGDIYFSLSKAIGGEPWLDNYSTYYAEMKRASTFLEHAARIQLPADQVQWLALSNNDFAKLCDSQAAKMQTAMLTLGVINNVVDSIESLNNLPSTR
ncbi:hypothetical protein [Achromobacter phage Motura]|uniref:Uncharacterized protein n=1 Tax=Achromobacter phage Motura TaxID=2591403 RepID=A0A514CST5_9CAUD|nr:hypothetical protein H1O15_gp255 [Achromobacter phage Motura]QDH83533.1 hypothetical protein [Achromobacter phage Motura]